MKKTLSLILVLMFCMASVAMAAPSPVLVVAPTAEGGTFEVVPVNVETEMENYENNPEQYVGAEAFRMVKDLPMVAISAGKLTPNPDAKSVKITAGVPKDASGNALTLKDGDKVAVAICIPGWFGDAIQGEVIDGQIVFELDEELLIALSSIPGFDGNVTFVFFKGEIENEA